MNVVVIGGGLAGMTAARQIAKRGAKVTLLERTERLGGKAGSDVKGGRNVEHGYHVFPKWYPNVRAILAETRTQLVDFDRYHYLTAGKFPDFVTVRGPSDLASLVHNVRHGILPWYQTVLFLGSTLDLISRSLSEKRLLDRISQIGVMRDAWFMTEEVAELNQENMLKASAIPAYDMSAMTAKKIGGYWMRQASPFLSVLPGDLQKTFIEPYAALVTGGATPVDVRFRTEVTGLDVASGRIAAARFGPGPNDRIEADAFVLATPFEVARKLVDGQVFTLDPSLGNMHWLEAQPMASLHVRFKRKIERIPREHVFFHGGDYGLSFIDVAQIWQNHPVPTELSFISSNFAPLRSLSSADATSVLMGEVAKYVPFEPSDVDGTVLNPNVDVPLFINTIGAWPNRPTPRSAIKNLYLAGDHVQNAIDLACMEGAVSSALAAARCLLEDRAYVDLPEVAVPPTYPRPLLAAGLAAMTPALAVANLVARVKERLGGSA
jgi:phytoene dehydrogenase-like protein